MEHNTVLVSFLAENYFTQLHTSLKKYIRKKNAADLHKARVCMKKLRCLIQFASDSGLPGKWKRYEKGLHKIFRKAGKVRDLQVCMALLHEYALEEKNLYRFFERKYATGVRKFEHSALRYLPQIKQIKHKLSKKEICTTTEVLSRYVVACNDHLLLLLGISDSNDYWHDIRKEIKKILYTREWLEADVFPVRPELISLYVQMERTAGEWNNEQVLLAAITDKKNRKLAQYEFEQQRNTLAEELNAIAKKISAQNFPQ
ncbi:MAG: CHAD domain-containing protein [Chitinophagales bacterium]